MKKGVLLSWSDSTRAVFLAVALVAVLATALTPAVTLADESVTSSINTKIWGRAAFSMHYDTGDLRGMTDFATYLVAEDEEELNFNPRDTRLGYKAWAEDGDYKYTGVFEMDFYGDNAGNNLLPRLRLGYGEMAHVDGWSLRAGQDWIPVAQQNPATLDFGILAWGGNLWWRVPQVTFRYKTGDVELLGSAMKHRISSEQEIEEKMPWMLARVAYSNFLNGKGTLALGGGFRSVEFEYAHEQGDSSWTTTSEFSSYLLVGELNLPFTDQVSLVSEFWTGAGVGREFVRYGLDYNSAYDNGEGTEIASMGGFASLSFKATPKVSLNVGGGMDMADEDDAEGSGAPFQKNTVIFGNVKHEMSKNFGVGAEVMHFITEQVGGEELTGQRFTAGTWFSF